MIQIKLLGKPAIQEDNALKDFTKPDFKTPRITISILGYLSEYREGVERDKLDTLLWSESTDPRRNLRNAIREIRSGLPDILPSRTSLLKLQGDYQFDTWEFLALSSKQNNLESWCQAETLYCGAFLEGIMPPDKELAAENPRTFARWLETTRHQWEERYAMLLQRIIETYLQQKNSEKALPYANKSKSLDPEKRSEETAQLLMHLYSETTQYVEVVEVYLALKRKLAAENTSPNAISTDFYEHAVAQIPRYSYRTLPSSKLQEITPNARQFLSYRNPIRIGLTLAWWLICGVLPNIALFIDHGEQAFLFAKLYPSFYLWTLFIGFAIPFMLFPSLYYILSWNPRTRPVVLIGVYITIFFSAYITYSDTLSAPPALWEFKHITALDIIEVENHGTVEHRLLLQNTTLPEETILSKQSFISSLQNILDQCRGAQTAGSNCKNHKKHLSTLLQQRVTQGEWVKSFTHYVYLTSLFFFALVFCLSFLTLANLVVIIIQNNINISPLDQHFAVIYLLFFSLWMPFRLYALYEKGHFYGEASYTMEMAIMVVMFVTFFYSLYITWRTSKVFWIHLAALIIGIAFTTLTLLSPETAAQIIGRNSKISYYPFITMGLIVPLLPWILLEKGKHHPSSKGV